MEKKRNPYRVAQAVLEDLEVGCTPLASEVEELCRAVKLAYCNEKLVGAEYLGPGVKVYTVIAVDGMARNYMLQKKGTKETVLVSPWELRKEYTRVL